MMQEMKNYKSELEKLKNQVIEFRKESRIKEKTFQNQDEIRRHTRLNKHNRGKQKKDNIFKSQKQNKAMRIQEE